MNSTLQILLVEDNPDDRALVARELSREFPGCEFTQATNLMDLNMAVQHGRWDLVVTDHQLNWSDGFTVLTAVKKRWPDCPVIMFSGCGNEEVAVQAMKAGLDDYVLKSPKHYVRLAAAAHMALERAKQRGRLREVESRYRTLFNRVPVGLFCAALDGRIMEVNPAIIRMLNYPDRETLLQVNAGCLFGDARQRRRWLAAIRHATVVERFELQLRRRNGKRVWVEINARVVHDEHGRPQYCEGSAEYITARKRAEAEVLESREQLRALAGHLQSIREQERTRLAGEVRNELGEALAGLKSRLALLRDNMSCPDADSSLASTRSQLKSLPEAVDPLMAAVRRIGAGLRPAVLDDLGLEAAMEWQIHEFEGRTGVRCEFVSKFRQEKLDRELATAVFRILQETLTHVVLPARATEARIELREETNKLVLEVYNNGKGPGGREISRRRSLDLLGLRERANMVDGKISINRQGKGMLVGVRIPFRHLVNAEKIAVQN